MIKFIEVKNVEKLACLAAEIWHEYWVEILSFEQINYMVNKFQSKKAIERQLKEEHYIYFFIEFDGKNIGYIGMSRKKDHLFLSKLYIKKGYRHQGIGSKAFEFIKTFAKENNYNRITLTVNKYNTNTIKTYKKWNFHEISSVVTDIGQGFVMDDYIMEYRL